MTHVLIRCAVAGALAGGLTACASSPTYPISAPPPPPPPPQSAPPTAPPVSSDAPPAATAHPAPDSVSSAPLQPVTPSSPAPSGSQPLSGRADLESTQAPAVAETTPVRQAETAPRRPVTRYVATGKVIDAHRMYRDYVVRKGDHLDAIARDLQTTRAVIVEANHLRDPDNIQPGQHLRIPVEKAYVVVSGDTLAAVARRFDVELADLADLNALPEHARLRSGDQLALPAVIHDKGPVSAPAYAERAFGAPAGGGYSASRWALEAGRLRGAAGEARPPAPYPTEAAPAAPTLSDADVTAAGRGRFVWPVRGEIISGFGVKDVSRRNDGVDIRAGEGTPVNAAAGGEVVYAGDQVPGFGNLVLIKHADGWVTAYAHLLRVEVRMRETVSQGQEIGQVGQSGGVSEPQLHFEVRYAPTPMDKAKPVDPQLVLPK